MTDMSGGFSATVGNVTSTNPSEKINPHQWCFWFNLPFIQPNMNGPLFKVTDVC